MGFRIREIEAESKFSSRLSLEVISRAVPPTVIEAVLAEQGAREQRERKLSASVTVLLVIAMNIFCHLSIAHVLKKIAQGLRYVCPDPGYKVAGKGAICYRRYQLGARPLAALFRRVCHPLATTDTPGAYLFGRHLMAMDGTTENVPDTPENVAAFGRHRNHRGPAAFPQVRAVYLAVVRTLSWMLGSGPSIPASARGPSACCARSRLGCWSWWMLACTSTTWYRPSYSVRVMSWPACQVTCKPSQCSHSLMAPIWPVSIPPSSVAADTVSIFWYASSSIRSMILDGLAMVSAIVWSRRLWSRKRRPALDLICAYHERWEIEMTIDEIDTHQRLLDRPLRSQKPVGVIQELYGLLIAHYAVRYLMHEAAMQAGVDPDHISFVHALRVLQDVIPEFEMTATEQLPRLYTRLLTDIADELLPARRERINPRVVKRKMSNFKLKRTEHYHWPQPTCSFREGVALI